MADSGAINITLEQYNQLCTGKQYEWIGFTVFGALFLGALVLSIYIATRDKDET